VKTWRRLELAKVQPGMKIRTSPHGVGRRVAAVTRGAWVYVTFTDGSTYDHGASEPVYVEVQS